MFDVLCWCHVRSLCSLTVSCSIPLFSGRVLFDLCSLLLSCSISLFSGGVMFDLSILLRCHARSVCSPVVSCSIYLFSGDLSVSMCLSVCLSVSLSLSLSLSPPPRLSPCFVQKKKYSYNIQSCTLRNNPRHNSVALLAFKVNFTSVEFPHTSSPLCLLPLSAFAGQT